MNDSDKKEKWEFEDYAFTIATVLCVTPIILGIFIASTGPEIAPEEVDYTSIHRWWPFSWISFMFAWSACVVKETIDLKIGKEGAKGELKDVAENALYITITTLMLFIGIIRGNMYSSWLAGPIVFVFFAVIWPILRGSKEEEQASAPALSFILLIAGIIMEIVIGGWIAFPLSWVAISCVKVYKIVQTNRFTEEIWVEIMYHIFTIIFLSASLIWDFWAVSWLAYPVSVIIGKIIDKKRKRKA